MSDLNFIAINNFTHDAMQNNSFAKITRLEDAEYTRSSVSNFRVKGK